MIWHGIMAVVVAGCAIAVRAAEPAADSPEARIRQMLELWPKSFNKREKPAVYAFFAPDLVASFPGQPDRNFEAMCKHLEGAMDDSKRRFQYDAPQIHEILVSGDLAVVRLTWTLRIREAGQLDEKITRERGIDVFKRQKDGTWKCSISYAHPEAKEKAKPK
jgi:ketosteroid isomerase-like protein